MDIKVESILENVIAGIVIFLLSYGIKKLLNWFVKIKEPLFKKANKYISYVIDFFLIKGGIFVFPVGWGVYMLFCLLISGPEVPIDKPFIIKTAFYFFYILFNFMLYLYNRAKFLYYKIKIHDNKISSIDLIVKFLVTKAEIDVNFSELEKELKKTENEINKLKK